MLTSPRQVRRSRRWLWPAGWLLCAAWAAAFPLVSPLGPHRDWGTTAAIGYLLAAVLSAPRRDCRLLSAVVALGVSGLLPLLLAIRSGEGQSEVTVIGRAGTELLAHGSPYLDSPTSVLDLTPYLPGMATFGLPRALLGPDAALGDPRLWCAAAFLAAVGGAWQVLRRGGGSLHAAELPAERLPLALTAGSTVGRGVGRSGLRRLGRATLAADAAADPTTLPAPTGDKYTTQGHPHPWARPTPPNPQATTLRTLRPSALRVDRPVFAWCARRLPLLTQHPSFSLSLAPGAVALVASPVVALPLAVSGVDLPMTGLLCLALALAARRHAGGAGLALAVACTLKWTAWPAVPVAVALLGAVAGRQAAWRCAGVAATVATALMAPWLVLAPGPMVRQVFAFPLGLGKWRTPAASPLPGRLLAQLAPGGWWLALALLLLGGGAVAVSLVRRPPTNAIAAADRLAVGLALAFLLAPAGRFGYLALPLFLAVFTRLASGRAGARRTSTPAPQPGVGQPVPRGAAPSSSPTDPPTERRPTSPEPVSTGRRP
ncbi:hypothetical protein [Kitasatospora sp. NPDC059673]|uniref:hypothetical protein n=1 Tax=Kitasatospora sp. NPDC059673 TaxID=3346901 RepID=UPI0036CE64B3